MKTGRRVIPVLCLLGLWLGGMVAVQAQTRTVHVYYTDPQGTVLAKTDAQGNIIARYDYTPYGDSVASLGNPPNGPGYTGHVNDPETGLVYMQQRYYQPDGRFPSPDPVGPVPGNLFGFNRYAYANNNPIVNTDPTGAFPGDADECSHLSYPCFVSMSGSNGGGGGQDSSRTESAVIPERTPKSMEKYFKSTDWMSRANAALAVMRYYGIDDSGIKCCSYDEKTTLYYAMMQPNGELNLSGLLFTRSFGYIGAVLYHEVGVHWQMQDTKNAIFDGIYTQAWYMREVQAYDYETSRESIRRFGLTPSEVREERIKRDGNYQRLSPSNKALVNKGIYLPAPSGI